ncbi:hypothetical protein [Bosea sp. BH3]|uniref:hypothetical protein n=1 Tax=Bosea sp. BH3 TaxID=2871701 RepID=UPI0021CB30C8|nr:hypothetical protein [Bosea sp. BH3]MCU4178621.1 hypothetical protein [Bosea sp. BH3]
MIARSRYVKDDPGRVGHLLSTSNNRRVVEHRDLDRGCPGDLGQFLALSSALTAAHPRAKITLAHFKISPSLLLTRRQLLRVIARIKRENGISRGHPMRLIEHDKGDRPPHFHLLFSAVDPETGRVLSSKDNYARDELVSRRLEIDFGEKIIPGPRVKRNAADLRARGQIREAAILDRYDPVRRVGKSNEADRQQAARTKLPVADFRQRLVAAVEKGVRSESLSRALVGQGFSVAIGNRNETLMAVHDETGMALPFLGSIAIASDGRLKLDPVAIDELRRDAPPLAQARREGAARTLKRANRDLGREIDRGRFEAAVDGDIDNVFSRMQRVQKKADADNQSTERLRSQAALRRATLAARREATRVRQIRINRAFRTARIVQSRRARRTAFVLAAGGMLLTGAGLSIALGVGVVATAALAGYGGALRIEAKALIAAGRLPVAVTRDQVRQSIDAATVLGAGKALTENPPSAPHDQPKSGDFDFASIRKSQRVLAALAMDALLGKSVAIASDALERALGADAMTGLAALVKDGSARQRRIVQSWNGSRSSDAFAAETALRRAGEREAAKIMAGIGRHRVVAERSQSTGRG